MLTSYSLEFSLPMHSYSLFCPVSLVVARALAADAFEPSFATLDELLNRPLFNEHTACIYLPWKNELLGDEIFPISYNRFWNVWRRTVMVAGFPDGLRPYAIRVGAGSRLDGMFQQAPQDPNSSNKSLTSIYRHHRPSPEESPSLPYDRGVREKLPSKTRERESPYSPGARDGYGE